METVMALRKFTSGRGYEWQCERCLAMHERSTTKCSTATFRIRLEGSQGAGGGKEVLRFADDVVKVDGEGNGKGGVLFINSRVAVCTPCEPRRAHDPHGKVVAKGSCSGRRPTDDGKLRDAPEDSCFVLVLNPSGIEGLDLGEATHLIKTEPIAREDKERQAEARGRRLGASPIPPPRPTGALRLLAPWPLKTRS